MSPRHPPASSDEKLAVHAHLTFETAAQHATARVPIVEPGQTVGAVRARLAGGHFESASHVVVCNAGTFLGIATLENVLSAPADVTIDTVMDPDPPSVAPGVDQEVAAWRAVRHGESALAVVTADGQFKGIIPPYRMVAVLLSEHEEDLSRLGGFLKGTSIARASSEERVPLRFAHRLPWLLLGLLGALLAAEVVGWFETQLRLNLVLAFFIPGIVYIADAVGTQTETVVVRGLSLGVPLGRMAWRELLAGLVIGIALAVIAGPLVWWHWGDVELGLSVGLSVFAATSTATVAAMGLPWLISAFGSDPAFGSGPLATVVQDLLSIWIYLTVTTWVMP